MAKKIAVLLAEGFEESEAIVPMDIAIRAGIEIIKVSVSGKTEVNGAHNICVKTDKGLAEADFDAVDMIMLPGGMPGTVNLETSDEVKAIVLEANKKGKKIAAICAAPRMLGDWGLLEGKRATVYPGNEGHLKGAIHDPDAKAVTDGNIITARGMGCAVEFGSEIVTALSDAGTARKVLDSIQY
ncbi:MAG: DJ-1/PfpI family protein [Lachnospiraceae bacterium]|nr:DJ-1/PfpI family protein [Lachnospiraceae bacterium]